MASRVNVKFIVILSVVLVLMFGGVMALLYSVLTRDGEDYIELGDKLKAEGDQAQAVKMYEKAVGHDPTNVEWLNIWLDNLLEWTPPTQVEYEKAYGTYYMGILRALAQVLEYDPAAQRQLLDAQYQQISLTGGSAEAWEQLLVQSESSYERLNSNSVEAEQIRRYIGLAAIQMMLRLPEDAIVREKAFEHMTAAAEADPQDLECLLGLVQWESSEWGRARRTGRPEVADKHLAQLDARLAELDQRFPAHPRVEQSLLRRNIESSLIGKGTRQERVDILRSMQGAEEETLSAYRTSDYQPTASDLDDLRRTLVLLRPEDSAETMLAVTDIALSHDPTDPLLLFYRGQRLRDMRRDEDAIEAFQTVIDLEDRPVSLRGLILSNFRTAATFEQAEAQLRQWERAAGTPGQDERLEQARERYAALVEIVQGGDQAPQAMLIEAKIAMAEGDSRGAIQILNDLDTQTGRENIEVKKLLAASLLTMGQEGAAREQYDVVTEKAPWDSQGALAAVPLDIKMQDYDRARERLQAALRYNPDNPVLNTRLEEVLVAAGQSEGVKDPLLQRMAEAQRLVRQDRHAEAKPIVEAALSQFGEDPRLLGMLIEIVAQERDTEELTAVVDRALASYPENTAFRQIKERLEFYNIAPEDRAGLVEGKIDEADIPEMQKELQKYTLFRRIDDRARAREHLDRAATLDPEHPGVIDALFVEALADDDLEAARRHAQTASRVDADQCGGALFAARLHLAEGDLAAAMSTLQRGVEQAPFNPTAWRLLGQVQLQLGQSADAVVSLQKSYDINPSDAENAEIYIRGLAQLQMNARALEVARQAHGLSPNDPGLNDIWLVLEENSGDKGLALRERTKRYDANPLNERNTIAYLSLLMDLEQWDQARAVLESVRAQQDSLPLALQNARMQALTGDESVEQGQEILKSYIAGLGADMNEEPYVAMARFLLEFDRVDLALAAFRQAETHQDPATMSATRAKADFLFLAGRNEESAEAYGSMLSAGVDTADQYIALRAIESHTRMQDWAGAEAVYEREFSGTESDSRMLLLLSQIRSGLGNTVEASRLVDEAVRIAPNDPRPFVVRAQMNMTDDALYRDVVRDLKQAIALQPSMIQGYLMLADLERRRGDLRAAIGELRQGMEAVPESDDIRQTLIRYLLAAREYEGAQLAVQEAVELSDGDVSWVLAAGDVYRASATAAQSEGRRQSASTQWSRAVDWYARASELEPDSREISRRRVKAMLEADSENAGDALRILDEIGSDVNTLPGLMILKARALALEGESEEAKQLAADALAVVDSSYAYGLWYNEIKDLMPRRLLVEFMLGLTPPESITGVWEVYLARIRLPDFDAHDELVSNLRRVEPIVVEPADRSELYSVLGTIFYANGRFEEAAEAFEAGLEVDPSDREFLNNLAFTLADKLGRLEEALEYAERAVALYPTDSGLLDTMGYIYLRLGREGQAEQFLSRALTHASRASEQVPAHLHLAQVKLNQGNTAMARRQLNDASDLLDRNPGLIAEYGPELDRLMEALNSAE